MLRSAVSRLTELFRRVTVADEKPISVTLLSLGLILTFVEYKNYQANERVKTSYQHVREWEERGYKEAFDQVSGVIRETKAKALDAMPQELLEDMTAPERDLAQLNTVMNRLAQDADLAPQLSQLFYFFDKLSVCADRNLCDEALLADFFGENLLRFDVYAKTYVARQRDEIDGYALLTESYVVRLRAPPWSVWQLWPF